MLVKTAAQTDHAENFFFLRWKTDENSPRYVNRVAGDRVLKIHAGVELDSRARVVVHNVFINQVRINRLKMIRQTIVRAAEIETFVFSAQSQIPFAGNQKTVVVAEVIVE